MANTYTQIHIHAVFAVQNRVSLIKEGWEDDLYKYITGIVQTNTHKLLAINGMPDHVHLLFGMRPIQSLSDLMQDIKGSSSLWINKSGFVRGDFSWQEGYGAFSYAKSDVSGVISYILNQKEHHKRKSFNEEYLKILKDFEIDYDKKYLFHKVDY